MTTDTQMPVAPVFDGLDPLPWSTVYELMKFHHDHVLHLSTDVEPDPAKPVEVSADSLRSLLRFVGARIGNGDMRVPRHLEAYRVISLVPENYGAALFGVPARP